MSLEGHGCVSGALCTHGVRTRLKLRGFIHWQSRKPRRTTDKSTS